MRRLGFRVLLPDALQAPIIVTLHMPADPHLAFERFYEGLRRGYVTHPGKLTAAASFRSRCIGRLGVKEMRGALAAVEDILDTMGVASGAPGSA